MKRKYFLDLQIEILSANNYLKKQGTSSTSL